MKKEEWEKLKDEIKRLHPLLRLKKLRELSKEETDEVILEEISQIIEDTKKTLGVEEITTVPESAPISIPQPVITEQLSPVQEALDKKVESDVSAVVEETPPDVRYERSTPDYSTQPEPIPDESEVMVEMYESLRKLRASAAEKKRLEQEDVTALESLKDNLISMLPELQSRAEHDPMVKENLLKIEYALRDIDTYKRKDEDTSTF